MTANDDNIKTLLATSTPTGTLDHAAVESRARQLRSEVLRTSFGALVRRTRHAWAARAHRTGDAHAYDCGRMHETRECQC